VPLPCHDRSNLIVKTLTTIHCYDLVCSIGLLLHDRFYSANATRPMISKVVSDTQRSSSTCILHYIPPSLMVPNVLKSERKKEFAYRGFVDLRDFFSVYGPHQHGISRVSFASIFFWAGNSPILRPILSCEKKVWVS